MPTPLKTTPTHNLRRCTIIFTSYIFCLCVCVSVQEALSNIPSHNIHIYILTNIVYSTEKYLLQFSLDIPSSVSSSRLCVFVFVFLYHLCYLHIPKHIHSWLWYNDDVRLYSQSPAPHIYPLYREEEKTHSIHTNNTSQYTYSHTYRFKEDATKVSSRIHSITVTATVPNSIP